MAQNTSLIHDFENCSQSSNHSITRSVLNFTGLSSSSFPGVTHDGGISLAKKTINYNVN